MKLSSAQVDSLLKLVGQTRQRELNCDECLDQVSEFAEYRLSGKQLPAALKAVEHHLAFCAECREEYEALHLALNTLKRDDS